ncbi:hypothetical protein HYU11_04450 [Candidatus Woesearchaeota archaeon]|nr:hypothetical protein [Candidatus Woesearchaeota archaeon]
MTELRKQNKKLGEEMASLRENYQQLQEDIKKENCQNGMSIWLKPIYVVIGRSKKASTGHEGTTYLIKKKHGQEKWTRKLLKN